MKRLALQCFPHMVVASNHVGILLLMAMFTIEVTVLRGRVVQGDSNAATDWLPFDLGSKDTADVQGRLTVDNDPVAILEVSVNNVT